MYHCHFEDVEHVQMGMTGIVFVRPLQDGTHHRRLHQVRLQRRRRLDRLRPPLRDPAERDLVATSTTATGTSRSRSRPTTTRSGSPSTAAATRRRCCPTTTRCRAAGRPRHLVGITHGQPELRHGRPQPAELVADPGQPGRAGAAAAGQPRLPAARDAAAGHPACTSSARTPRCCATAASTPRTGRTPSTSARARRATCSSTRRPTTPARPSGIGRARHLQRLLLQEPGLAEAVQQRRSRARRHDDRGAGLPEPAARPDRS